MSELLAPAGNYEAFMAAISNGCDAIYLGLDMYSARAYADNFNIDNIKEIIDYAHLRNVKIFITMNTVLYEDELNSAYQTLNRLNEYGCDGIIVCDLALFTYIKDNFDNLEAHCSTQMGIDSLDGVKLLEEMKADRIVLSREVSIENVRKIKKETKVPIELFVHGALCVSYSGNCLMSGLIGLRSGNRGRCVGCCRKEFTLYNDIKTFGKNYLLSMKDLNTTSYIKDIQIADSLKIEGRMKEPTYVASVVRTYRDLINNNISVLEANANLEKTFHRTFTKGYLFNEDKKLVTNTLKPNNFGYKIGRISNIKGNKAFIELTKELNQGDQIRIASKKEVNIPIVKLYDKSNQLVSSSKNYAGIELRESVNIGDLVYKTMDTKYLSKVKQTYPREFSRIPLQFYFTAKIGMPLELTISHNNKFITAYGTIPQEASNSPLTKEKIYAQLEKLNDTPYYIENHVITLDSNLFVPVKCINELRRDAIELLNKTRLNNREYYDGKSLYRKINFESKEPSLACYCNTQEQYEICKKLNIEHIYYNNVSRRNNTEYPTTENEILVGGYNSIYHYQGNYMVSDFSLNVCNSKTVNVLHSIGVKRVTLSHEINHKQIKSLVAEYEKQTGGLPNLEMIVYGRQDLLFTEYCPLKNYNLCGKCKDKQYYIRDEKASFPLISHKDCTTTILNSKILNLIDELNKIENINVFRLQFTIEDSLETERIIKMYQNKLLTKEKTSLFDEKINTRGHFNKQIL